MTSTEDIQITVAGVYDIPAEVYHADPVPGGSLSASGARMLLPPSCPALFKAGHKEPTHAMELGTAAHAIVLGIGPELVRIDAEEWRSNAVKQEVADARERGALPLKPAEYEQVHAMVAALRAHPIASAIFAPGAGQAERSLFWPDEGIWRRARLDWLPATVPGRRLIVADYKTCRSASPENLPKQIEDFGYHQSAAWYLDAVTALGLAPEGAAFLLVFQEKTAPYLVTVVEPSPLAMAIGRARNAEAIEIYRRCRETDTWPGYSDDIEQIGLPRWVEAKYEMEMSQ